MDPLVLTYTAYVALAVPITLWVGATLRRNGRVFLLDVFDGDEELASAVNHLLVVGFYLVNVGYITLALKYGDKPTDVQGAVEFISTKVGLVLVVLGGMHFFNMSAIARFGRKVNAWFDEQPRTYAPMPNADGRMLR